MDPQKAKVLVGICINYGHNGYLQLENQDLCCLYIECLTIAQYFGDTSSVIQLYMLLGELKEDAYLAEEASTYFKYMQKITERKGNEVHAAAAFMLGAVRYARMCKFDKAIQCCEKALKISANLGILLSKKIIEGNIYGMLGSIYQKLGDFHKTMKYSEDSLKIAKETGNKEIEGTACLHLGIAHHQLGNSNKAVRYAKKCVSIAKQIDNKTLLGSAYSNLGLVYQDLGNVDQALSYCRQSLKIRREIGDRDGESTSYLNLGVLYRILGKHQEAISCYQKCLHIAIKIGNKNLEGTLYTNLGAIYWLSGKYHETMECFEKGLEVSKYTGDRKEEGKIYMHFGGLYNSVGKYQECLKNLEKSLEIFIEIGDKKGQINCYGNLGIIHQKMGRYQKALEYHNQCLNNAITAGNKLAQGNAYDHIGGIYIALGNPQKAIKYLEKSLKIATEIGDKQGEGDTYNHLGKAYFDMEMYDEAIKCEEKSLNTAIATDNKLTELSANQALGSFYYNLSVMYDEKGNQERCQNLKEKSKCFLKKAVKCSEWKFSHLKDLNDFKISIVDTFIHTFKLLTEVLIETQQVEEALLVCDRGRARSLGDILLWKYGIREKRAPSSSPFDSTDLESVLGGKPDFSILFLAIGVKGLHIWVLSHQKQVFIVTIKYQELTAMSVCDPEKRKEKDDIQTALAKVISDSYSKMQVRQTVKSEDRSFESSGNSQELESSLMSPNERNSSGVEELQTMASDNQQETNPLEMLFKLLITPVLQNLLQEVVIVPDGPLHMIPFAALRDPNTGLFLSETKLIRLAPSLASLKTLQDCPSEFHSKNGALIVGDPDVGEVILKGKKRFLTRLPSAKHEAEIIGSILDTEPVTGSQATKDMVKQKLKEGVAVIHIAAHGDSENGHIALAPSTRTEAKIPEEQDYMLTMQEVQEIGVKAQLVVLSCCHSGRGEIRSEGVVGMSRAFLAAGARAVVASLWAVHDDVTMSFMVSFYRFLKMGESASKSLQQAMKEIREEGYEEPRYWAPFFLIGDDVTTSLI